MTWLFGVIATMALDFLIFEIVWELIIACLFSNRRKSRMWLRTAEFLNRARSIKTLS
jgi:hypothetical protein